MMDYKLSNALKIANILLSHAKTGYSITWYGDIPINGYMVSIDKIGLQFDSISNINEHEISAWINEKHTEYPNDYFGIYKSDDDGKIYVDVSINMLTLSSAIEFGKEQNQRYIYDVFNNKNIML